MSATLTKNPQAINGAQDPLSAPISVFSDAESARASGETTISDFLRDINIGTWREPVEEIRGLIEGFRNKEAGVLKKMLPAVSLSGVVTSGGRGKAFQDGRFQHSGWLQVDLDGKDFHPLTPEVVRDEIGADDHILAAFISPSGTGVKALCRIPVCGTPDEHLSAFHGAQQYFRDRYGLEIDASTKDPVRFCFVSYDPDAVFHDWSKPCSVLPVAGPPTKKDKDKPSTTGTGIVVRGHQDRDGWTLDDLAEMIAPIPRPEYGVWLEIISGAWNHFGEAATSVLAAHWPEEEDGEYARKFQAKTSEHTMGTVVFHAKAHGWRPRSTRQLAIIKESAQTAPRSSLENPPSPDVFRAMLAERRFYNATVPPKPIPVLMLGDKIISTPGNLTNIQAPAKAGKSAVVGAMIAAMMNGNRIGPDTLGFSADNTEERAVLHFDTEQSRYDHDGLIRRAMTRARVEEPPAWFYSFSLTDLPHGNRTLCIERAIGDAGEKHGGIFAVLIDGIADICKDPNNAEEAFHLVDEWHATAIRHDCAIITVLHENPGSETGKMRGHLGSQLERKAETPLRLAKDPITGITTIWSDRARHCHIPKDQGTCFIWSDVQGMHVSAGTAREIKATAKHTQLRDEAEAAFGEEESMSHGGLVTRIIEVIGKTKRTAERRIRDYQAEGIMIKKRDGNYLLKPDLPTRRQTTDIQPT